MGFLNRHFLIALAMLSGWFLTAGDVCAQGSREYDLKAVFLYNFASFVEWPGTTFAGPDAPFVVGILGQDPFGSVLDEVMAGERVKNRPLVLRRLTRAEDAGGCHILFVSGSEADRMRDVLASCEKMPVLTVGDFPGFAEAGGVIGFRTEDKKLKIDLNLKAAKTAGLTVSSKLLKVARLVGEPSP
jgi:hypothetical protein